MGQSNNQPHNAALLTALAQLQAAVKELAGLVESAGPLPPITAAKALVMTDTVLGKIGKHRAAIHAASQSNGSKK